MAEALRRSYGWMSSASSDSWIGTAIAANCDPANVLVPQTGLREIASYWLCQAGPPKYCASFGHRLHKIHAYGAMSNQKTIYAKEDGLCDIARAVRVTYGRY